MKINSYAYLCVVYWFLVPSLHGLQPFERRPEETSQKWQRLEQADPTSSIHLKVAISNINDDEFEKRVIQIATPFSGYYRKHMGALELAAWSEPPKRDVQKVLNWLSSNGIHAQQHHDLVTATMTISKAQSLLNTTYYHFHDDLDRVVTRADQYYVPPDLSRIIEFVHPTVNFPISGRRRKLVPKDLSTFHDTGIADLDLHSTNPCASRLKPPACMEHLYNVDYTAPVKTNVTVESYLIYGRQLNKTSLRTYLKRFNPLGANAHPLYTFHHLGKVYPADDNPHGSIAEEELDMQMILGHGYPVKAAYTTIQGNAAIYAFGPRPGTPMPPKKKLHHYEEFYVDFIHSLAHTEYVPAATTLSEGVNESMLTPSYMRFLCKLFAQLSARGVSQLIASGDDGSNTDVNKKTGKARFLPEWPGTCPFVTTVGGTVLANNTNELAITYATRKYQGIGFASSGGFSDVFARPIYQNTDIPQYLKNHGLVKKYGNITGFNPAGRGYPDIALIGATLPGIYDGHLTEIGGTSASSPMAAAFIGRLVAYEQSKGRPPLGLLNPWFYKYPEILNDITCCGTNDITLYERHPPSFRTGYPVAKGWDAVTGLGSFNFAKMKNHLDHLAAVGALG